MYELKKDSREAIERLLKHLPEKDLCLITLKGHLLIEEELEKIISLKCVSAEKLKDGRLGFSHKCTVANALFGDIEELPHFWKSIRLLNGARNEYSHNLESLKALKKIDDFVAMVIPDALDVSNKEEKLRIAIVGIFVGLRGAVDGYKLALEYFNIKQ